MRELGNGPTPEEMGITPEKNEELPATMELQPETLGLSTVRVESDLYVGELQAGDVTIRVAWDGQEADTPYDISIPAFDEQPYVTRIGSELHGAVTIANTPEEVAAVVAYLKEMAAEGIEHIRDTYPRIRKEAQDRAGR